MLNAVAMVGGQDLIIVLVIVLVLFGGKKIPELLRGVGKGVGELQKGLDEGKRQLTQSLHEEPAAYVPPSTPVAASVAHTETPTTTSTSSGTVG